MKILLTIIFALSFNFSFGQYPTNISGTIVDENDKPITSAMIHYGKDTAYTNSEGRFNVAYPNPQQSWYYFYIEKEGFLPKSFRIDLSEKNIALTKPFIIRSRKGFWYDTKAIDSNHIGITVREAISKYKLDIEACILWDEPPGKYYGFTTELGDSSYVLFTIQRRLSRDKRLKMKDVLDQRIIGFGIADTKGNETIIGDSFVHDNPYYIEQKLKSQ